MKKGNSKKPQRRASNDDFSSLNNELGGSFGLEPPKHYREDDKPQRPAKSTKQTQRKNSPQSKEEIRRVQKKKRKRSKMFYRVVSSVAIILAIVGVIVALSLTVFFKIDKINVVGNKKYTTAEVVQMLPIKEGKNLFMANSEAAKVHLEENMPYIYKAEIKKKLPSTIVVTVTETPKIYTIKNADKSYTLLDSNLKVLEITNKKPKKSVAIKDAKVKSVASGKKIKLADKNAAKNLQAITKLITKLKLEEITAISSTDVNNSAIVYDSRITIKLGSIDKLENKVYAALTAIEKLNESDPSATGTITATNDKQIYFTEE